MFRSFSYAREADLYKKMRRIWESLNVYAEQNIKMIEIIDNLNQRITALEKRHGK